MTLDIKCVIFQCSGKSLIFEVSMVSIFELQALIPQMSPRDQAFAVSLVNQSTKRGLSPKQQEWVEKLVNKVNGKDVVVAEQIDVTGILNLLQTAGQKLKYPKVRLATASGDKVVLGIAGEKSNYAGSVMITDGGPYGSNRFYGRVSPTGEFVPGRNNTDEVTALLKMFAADPATVASRIGKQLGSCCFCGRKLNTTESLDVGYGSTCAQKYNLPWG